MKHLLYIMLTAIFIVMAASCGNIIETSSSGKLTGQWQLLTIDTLATGGRLEMKEDRKYYSVEDRLFWIHDADRESGFMATYVHANGKLTLNDFTLYTHGLSQEPEVTDISELQPFGINAFTETFTITLGSKTMTLENDKLRITLRKF